MEKDCEQKKIAIDISEVVLMTDRLVLRQWTEKDLADFYEYASVKGVGEPAGWKPHESVEESKKILDIFIKYKNDFAITLKSGGKVIGSIGIHDADWAKEDEKYSGLKIKELGYALAKDYWGRGLMAEAVVSVVKYCFETYSFDALSCCYFGQNTQSQRVIEKCGFTFLKKDKFFSEFHQAEFDDNIYILFRDNYSPQ